VTGRKRRLVVRDEPDRERRTGSSDELLRDADGDTSTTQGDARSQRDQEALAPPPQGCGRDDREETQHRDGADGRDRSRRVDQPGWSVINEEAKAARVRVRSPVALGDILGDAREHDDCATDRCGGESEEPHAGRGQSQPVADGQQSVRAPMSDAGHCSDDSRHGRSPG
jgi:hypothetical protein